MSGAAPRETTSEAAGMVLKKDRISPESIDIVIMDAGEPAEAAMTSSVVDQPVSKRQRMDGTLDYSNGNRENSSPDFGTASKNGVHSSLDNESSTSNSLISSFNSRSSDGSPVQADRPENGVKINNFDHSNNSSSRSFHNNSDSVIITTISLPVTSGGTSVDEIDKAALVYDYSNHQNTSVIIQRDSTSSKKESSPSSSSSVSSASSSSLTTPSSSYPDLVKSTTAAVPNSTKSQSNSNDASELLDNEMLQFQNCLAKQQCLCGVSERILRRPFQSHYVSPDQSSPVRRIAGLSEWPTRKLIQFLSNLQLMFDVYLKQNAKGHICCRIMDVCDALIRNEQNLIDEIIDLCDYDNKFVQFLSGRVLSSFLIIAKDVMHNGNDSWLKKLIDNLFIFEHIDFVSIRRINFSLEIIKKIVEWKDVEQHPLDDGEEDAEGTSSDRLPLPPIENNYFAVHYNAEMVTSNSFQRASVPNSQPTNANAIQCQMVSLTDSESFDTSNLKCITIKNLENKWPALVKNMSTLILSHRDTNYSESCVLIFLQLWESIISVHTNLSIVETLPFYAQLDKFELLLLNDNLPCTIYKQMLTLFNEALCYGSTLALQDMLPEETCNLAHQVVRHVKDYRILDTLPRVHPENPVNFIGNREKTISYESGTFEEQSVTKSTEVGGDELMYQEALDMDKTLLQKMVLLVLKSVAVTVKEIRSDSSDSSVDSSDYEAFQDMVLIERSIRDVLKKLENFIKNTLEFHPESHFSKILIHLFDDQDDYLIEAMVCTLDVTVGISFRNNAFPELVSMLNPVLTFLEFLKMISNSSDLLLDLLVSNETCFLLYLLRFLKYIRLNWPMFVSSCRSSAIGNNCLDDAMSVLIRLRLQISRLVSRSLYPYDISPVLRLLESCESLYEGNELS